MAIKIEATEREQSSPFFRENKEICEQWEQCLLERDGKCSAAVAAWGLHLKGRLSHHIRIELRKRSNANASLLVSDEKNVFVQTKLSIAAPEAFSKPFRIRKRKWRDSISKPKGGSVLGSEYILTTAIAPEQLEGVVELISPYIQGWILNEVRFEDGTLILDIQDLVKDAEMIDRLLEFGL